MGVFHSVTTFEILLDAFDLGVLADELVVSISRTAIQNGQVLLRHSSLSHDMDNSKTFLLQVVIVALSQAPTRCNKH